MNRFTRETLTERLVENPDLSLDSAQDKSLEPQGKGQRGKTGKNKYHARRTYSQLCGRIFASKAEARRGEELALLLRAGEIEDLRYQVRFKLCRKPKITVTIDFSYLEKDARIFEDVKGVLTRDSRTKYAWLKAKHGIEVKLIRGSH